MPDPVLYIILRRAAGADRALTAVPWWALWPGKTGLSLSSRSLLVAEPRNTRRLLVRAEYP